MAVLESEPVGLEQLVAQLLLWYDDPPVIPRTTIRRPGQPGRRCRCDHPIGVPDDRYPSWVRCLLCGHDVEGCS